MQYVVMHKASPEDEAGKLPSQQLIEEMGALIGEAIKSGIFLAGEGLLPAGHRARLSFRNGRCTVQKGPYEGEHELPATLAAIRVADFEAGVAWARRFGEALGGDVDLEIGTLTEEWDLTNSPRPEGAPWRFLVVQKTNAATEAGKPLPADRRAALSKLLEESTRAGQLQFFETLQPSSQARRLLYRDNQRRVVDGPFSESKELIGGFCMLQLRSLDEAMEWTNRYVRILGGTAEVDIRPVAAPAAGGAR